MKAISYSSKAEVPFKVGKCNLFLPGTIINYDFHE